MKLIDDIRADNVRLLAAEHGGVTGLASKLERSESQISQWTNRSKNHGTGKPRGMRSSTARWLEDKCGKPEGWLDIEHKDDPIIHPDDEHVVPLRVESPPAQWSIQWPFPNISISRLLALPPEELLIIEGVLLGAVAATEARLAETAARRRR